MTDEQRHAIEIAAVVADFRKLGMTKRADNLQAELDRHLAAQVPVPGFDPSKVDWERPAWVGNITTHGTVIENRRIVGKCGVQAEDVALLNCPAEGLTLPTSGGAAVIDAYSSSAKRFWMEDCLVTVPTPDVRWENGVQIGPDATLVRVSVRGSVDGIGVFNKAGGTVQPTIIDPDVQGLVWFAVDPNHSDGSHNDPIQFHSPIGAGARLIGGLLDGGAKGTSCVMVNVSGVTGWIVRGVTFRNARSGLNFGPTPSASASGVVGCVFDTPVAVYATDGVKAGVRMAGNTRTDGTPVSSITRS